jgi:DNA-binding CsgD family transcriptional regulator
VWQALSAAPGIGVCVLTIEGVCVYSSPENRRIYWGDDSVDTRGMSIERLFPAPWVEERMAFFQRVVDERRPVAVRQVWRGHQICLVIRPVFGRGDEVTHLLCLSRPTDSLDCCSDFAEIAESEFVELGDLNVLTPRELVVLALLGQGLTLKEIAERLHRSFKTIDNHRASIGRKLRKTDRLALARLATQAGLRVRDAELQRVEHKSARLHRA